MTERIDFGSCETGHFVAIDAKMVSTHTEKMKRPRIS